MHNTYYWFDKVLHEVVKPIFVTKKHKATIFVIVSGSAAGVGNTKIVTFVGMKRGVPIHEAIVSATASLNINCNMSLNSIM